MLEEHPVLRVGFIKDESTGAPVQMIKTVEDSLFIDDIYDSGDTFKKVISKTEDPSSLVFATLFARKGKKFPKQLIYATQTKGNEYIVFPWDRFEYKLMKKFEFKTGAGFMIGIPGETMDDIRMTMDLAKELDPEWAYFQSFVGFPTSDLYQYVIDNDLYDLEWNNIYRVDHRFLGIESIRDLEDQLNQEFIDFKKNKIRNN